MLVEAQLGTKPGYQREQAEYEADVSSMKAGFLSTWGVGRTQPAVHSIPFLFRASAEQERKLMKIGEDRDGRMLRSWIPA